MFLSAVKNTRANELIETSRSIDQSLQKVRVLHRYDSTRPVHLLLPKALLSHFPSFRELLSSIIDTPDNVLLFNGLLLKEAAVSRQ